MSLVSRPERFTMRYAEFMSRFEIATEDLADRQLSDGLGAILRREGQWPTRS
jgi:hypothetical protein